MTDNEPFRPVIRTQLDLEAVWRRLMGPLGFAGQSVWMFLIGPDDRPIPQITQIEECTGPPSGEFEAGFSDFLRDLREEVAPEARFAFLRSRPGGGGVTAEDRAWACALYDAGRTAGVPVEVVHLAHDHDLQPIPMDEVLAEPA